MHVGIGEWEGNVAEPLSAAREPDGDGEPVRKADKRDDDRKHSRIRGWCKWLESAL